ncbi:hypothetical protein ACTMQE_21345 [Escherichia coli]
MPKILRVGKVHAFNGKTDRLQTFKSTKPGILRHQDSGKGGE